jgi:hypothetical protein
MNSRIWIAWRQPLRPIRLLLIPLIAVACLLTGVDSARAYDKDTHYALTYYLALILGYTPAQAQQIARLDYSVDDNPETEPLQLRNIVIPWADAQTPRVKFHAFPDSRNPDPADADAKVNNRLNQLWKEAQDIGNPGIFLHFLQDMFAHDGYESCVGHSLNSTIPDYISWDEDEAKRMIRATVFFLGKFREAQTGQKSASLSESDINKLFSLLSKANPWWHGLQYGKGPNYDNAAAVFKDLGVNVPDYSRYSIDKDGMPEPTARLVFNESASKKTVSSDPAATVTKPPTVATTPAASFPDLLSLVRTLGPNYSPPMNSTTANVPSSSPGSGNRAGKPVPAGDPLNSAAPPPVAKGQLKPTAKPADAAPLPVKEEPAGAPPGGKAESQPRIEMDENAPKFATRNCLANKLIANALLEKAKADLAKQKADADKLANKLKGVEQQLKKNEARMDPKAKNAADLANKWNNRKDNLDGEREALRREKANLDAEAARLAGSKNNAAIADYNRRAQLHNDKERLFRMKEESLAAARTKLDNTLGSLTAPQARAVKKEMDLTRERNQLKAGLDAANAQARKLQNQVDALRDAVTQLDCGIAMTY